MKKIFLIILLLSAWTAGFSQDNSDSLKIELAKANQDSVRVRLMNDLCSNYMFSRPDSALRYGHMALNLSSKLHDSHNAVGALIDLSFTYQAIGNDAKALQLDLQSLKVCEQNQLINEWSLTLYEMGRIYTQLRNYVEAKKVFEESIALNDPMRNYGTAVIIRGWYSKYFMAINNPDSAAYYAQAAYHIAHAHQDELNKSFALSFLGVAQYRLGDTAIAFSNLKKADSGLGSNYLNPVLTIAQLYEESGNRDSSLFYANKALRLSLRNGFLSKIVEAYTFLSKLYQNNPKQALLYSNQALNYKDSLFSLGMRIASESFVSYDQQQQQQELKESKIEYQSRLRTGALLGSTVIFLLIAFFLYRNNKSKQKANKKITTAYDQLKATQFQLIQSEKMASLGELTAGIAHEIQNPLNFVNNFSEVNKEMLEELKAERLKPKGERDEKTEDEIITDLIANEEKINHHGKRADAIVKSMLEHSRSSTGVKELTDINKLADEYLRLSYHGLRAKDKDFNAVPIAIGIKTDFDESIGKINIISQDIGRVLLNLYNNAFYACAERSRSAVNQQKSKNLISYEPTVWVSTKKSENGVTITVKDNGGGIPEKIKEKIFQPFFTTKPTGSGTGLGLSLSYDIIKAHGGEIKVESKEGDGTEFIIELPLNTRS